MLGDMATLQVETDLPQLTAAESLSGWRREFCIELLGEGQARIFVRAVEKSSYRAPELQRGILFQWLDPRFTDLAGCVNALRHDLERLADSAKRLRPSRDNLFRAVEYDSAAWEQVQHGVDLWARR